MTPNLPEPLHPCGAGPRGGMKSRCGVSGSVVRGAEDTPYGRLPAVADPTGAGFNLSSLEN